MFDSISNVNDYLSEHWLAEVFPAKLRDLGKGWKERAIQGKDTPIGGLSQISASYLRALGELSDPTHTEYAGMVGEIHRDLLHAAGFEANETVLETRQGETLISVPLLSRVPGVSGTDALHVLQAVPATDADSLFSDRAELLHPLQLKITKDKTERLASVSEAITQLFVSDHAPRYLLVVAGGTVLLTDASRWPEGRYLAFAVATALDRRDEKAVGELAHHAGLWSADVLLPNDDGKAVLDAFTEDSEKHAVGVSEDLREGLRISIEKIANEVLARRRVACDPVDGIPELPRDLTTQCLRFLYRILFLLFAEARPDLGILPVGAPEYGSGYGLDRLREIIQVPLTGRSADGHHLHESLNLLFRLVNNGHGGGLEDGDGLVFEAMRSDLFDPARTPLIDDTRISNRVLQEVLTLLLLSKPSKNKNRQRGYISYAQLGINQLGAVYEGLMSYSGLIADDDMVEIAKDGNADKGSWLVPSTKSGDYDAEDIVWREDRLTGRKDIVKHARGSFVFRLSGRDRQRSASYYTPEVLTKTVVTHALAELITADTTAAQLLEYRICEPALGSGAFLNEAINQLAAEYLARRQNELGMRIDPQRYTTELQNVKAYLALHRAYGVDLNATAVELAEVSLWLNVMHRGLQAPWFGLHLRRGNSLIGARRATYDFGALGRAKKSWLTTVPTDRPLSQGPIGEGEIHHFLLAANGWASVADSKQAKELSPEAVLVLKNWRKEVTRKPDKKQLDRLRALARRVERLWELAQRRLKISEVEVARRIEVWGANLVGSETAVPREQIESELFDPEGPYMRLRLAMDTWCAMWFWPIAESSAGLDDDGSKHVGPPSLDDWIATLESLLGSDGVRKARSDQTMFHETVESFDQLSKMDELERDFYGMRPIWKLVQERQWLGITRRISEEQGFFHWELDYAQIFEQGGFDLQVGNPPWVRPQWKDSDSLAEADPFFALTENAATAELARRRAAILSDRSFLDQYLLEVGSWAGVVAHLGSKTEHPILAGVKVNLYLNFMERAWRNSSQTGVIGLLHPEGHFSDPRANLVRREAYRRLRRHWQFVNMRLLFEDVHNMVLYGIHIYGPAGKIGFMQSAGLLDPSTLELSLAGEGGHEIPGTQFAWGGWDLRPHPSRITSVDRDTLSEWAALFDPPGTDAGDARLVRALTKEHGAVLRRLSEQALRLEDVGYRWTLCWDEAKSKKDGYIEWRSATPSSWSEVVLQGPSFTVANPAVRQPNDPCKSNKDWALLDLTELPATFIPRTNYQRATSVEKYNAGYLRWGNAAPVDYWRLIWRSMTQPGLERSLHPALLPPGATHVHTVNACVVSPGLGGARRDGPEVVLPNSVEEARNTVLMAGLWSSIPFDYLVKVSGQTHVQAEFVDRFPAPLGHPAGASLLLRTLRLNCLTEEYAPLWNALYGDEFSRDSWTFVYSYAADIRSSGAKWEYLSPLRSEFERRAALVEIDALAALMLGLTAEHLVLMYKAQFPVLRKYEYEMYFDARGRKIAKEHHAHGVKQRKDDFKLLQAFLAGDDSGDLPDRYTPFPPDENHDRPWFYKPDREAEMRTAYSEFARRLGLNG